MTYKTILVHVDESKRSFARIKMATEIANNHAAHVVGLAVTGVSRYIFEGSNINANDPNFTLHLALVRERAEKAIEQFKVAAKQLNMSSFECNIASDEANGGLGLRARYSDLVIIGQTNNDEPSPSVLSDFPEYMVMHAGKPVLVIPYSGDFSGSFEHPIIAWDSSRESSRAVSDALPFLINATSVRLVIFNPKENLEQHGDEPGADIAQFLSRHGVKVDVFIRHTTDNIGDALIHTAEELKCDLIVMGAYGHSRLREMLMGGVSKTIFAKMKLPVLMSH